MTSQKELITCWPPKEDGEIGVIVQADSSITNALQLQQKYTKRKKSPASLINPDVKDPKVSRTIGLEPLGNVLVSRWWRKYRKQQSKEGRNDVDQSTWPKTNNPDTTLCYMIKTAPVQTFIQSEIKRLNECLTSLDDLADLCVTASIHASLCTLYFMIDQFDVSFTHINHAVRLEPDDNSYKTLFHRIYRQMNASKKQTNALETFARNISMPKINFVRRIHVDELTMFEFFSRHALTSKPVIITGLAERLTKEPWTMEYLQERAGKTLVNLKRCVHGSVDWAGLEEGESMTLKQYIELLETYNHCEDEEKKRYLFDWSLPQNCPSLARELTIPKYFASDFLQRTDLGTIYRDTWPSLFISPKNITSRLHVDTFGSNFWMALFKGQKRWTFFDRADIPFLYPRYHTLDPVFDVNIDKPDLEKHPLYSQTHPNVCVLTEGEVLFVPAGCPHAVESLTESIAISSNFVDLSNRSLVLEELEANTEDERCADLLRQMKAQGFPLEMSTHQKDLTYEQFKKWPRDDHTVYDITS